MKYIITIVWTVILVSMLNYVVSSVQNVEFVLENGLIMAVPAVIMIFIIGAVIPNDPLPAKQH